MKVFKAGILLILILVLGVNALEIFDKQCESDGSLKLVVKSDSKAKVYTEDIVVKIGQTPAEGTWDTVYLMKSTTASREYSTFQSEENLLPVKRPYPLTIEYTLIEEDGNKTLETISSQIECPGLTFSCKNLHIDIESCENQKGDIFRAVINIKGLEQSEAATMNMVNVVDFILEAENKYKDMTGKETTRGTLPYKSQIVRLEKDKYVVRYEFSSKNRNTIKTLWAGYNNNLRYQCDQSKYPDVKFYDKVECKIEEFQEEEQGEEANVQTEVAEPVKNTKTAEQILQEQSKNYKPLAIISILLIVVLTVGGIILSYLYKRGYL